MARTLAAKHHKTKLRRDLLIILVSTFLAIILARSGIIYHIHSLSANIQFLDSFIAGTFFTSVFTTPLSIAAFASIAHTTNIYYMALWGACGAVLGDLILFLFIKNSLTDDIQYIMSLPRYKKLFSIFRFRIFRWLTPLIGALIIASPVPDEVGIAMMGLSHMRTAILIPVSFVMNFFGILLIGLAVQAL